MLKHRKRVSSSDDFVIVICFIIICVIGYFIAKRMTLGMRLNNPFNLRNSNYKWNGQIGEELGFCKFEKFEDGVRAGIINLKNGYFKKALNVREIIEMYAPKHENDTEAYIKAIQRLSVKFSGGEMSLESGEVIDKYEEKYLIIKAIANVEQGFDCVSDELIKKYL